MNTVRSYNSSLRRDQSEATKVRILAAMASLIDEGGGQEPTNRAVAERAQVTEVTVYRHFPSREALLKALWIHLNREAGVDAGFPVTVAELRAKIAPLLASFDANPAHITGRLTTAQGRAARASLDPERRDAFLSVVSEAAPGLPAVEHAKAAAVLQLLYSGYAWLSLREQWAVSGPAAADAVAWATDALLADLGRRGGAPLAAEAAFPATDDEISKATEEGP